MLKRLGHGAAAFSVSSECVGLILFGGITNTGLQDTTILGFGMF